MIGLLVEDKPSFKKSQSTLTRVQIIICNFKKKKGYQKHFSLKRAVRKVTGNYYVPEIKEKFMILHQFYTPFLNIYSAVQSCNMLGGFQGFGICLPHKSIFQIFYPLVCEFHELL